MPFAFPLALEITGRRCVVIGAGATAAANAHCHCASPTVTRRGDLVVAVSTGGRAPTLAGYVSDALAADLPDEFGALIDLVAEIRAEGIAPADTAERGRLWRAAFDCDVLGLLGAGQWEAARRLLRGVLAGTGRSGRRRLRDRAGPHFGARRAGLRRHPRHRPALRFVDRRCHRSWGRSCACRGGAPGSAPITHRLAPSANLPRGNPPTPRRTVSWPTSRAPRNSLP